MLSPSGGLSSVRLVQTRLELPELLDARIRRAALIAGYTPEQVVLLVLNSNLSQFENAWRTAERVR